MSPAGNVGGSEAGRVVRLRGYMSTADRHPLQFLRQLVAQARAYRTEARRLRGDDRAHARLAAAELEAWAVELRAALKLPTAAAMERAA